MCYFHPAEKLAVYAKLWVHEMMRSKWCGDMDLDTANAISWYYFLQPEKAKCNLRLGQKMTGFPEWWKCGGRRKREMCRWSVVCRFLGPQSNSGLTYIVKNKKQNRVRHRTVVQNEVPKIGCEISRMHVSISSLKLLSFSVTLPNK